MKWQRLNAFRPAGIVVMRRTMPTMKVMLLVAAAFVCSRVSGIIAELAFVGFGVSARQPISHIYGRGHRLRKSAAGRDDEYEGGLMESMFNSIADAVIPLGDADANSKMTAYMSYEDGMRAQQDGDLKGAYKLYAEALKHETDFRQRSAIYSNLGLLFAKNGEFTKAVKYYHLAIDADRKNAGAFHSIGVIYHNQGKKAEKNGQIRRASEFYDKVAEYWEQAVRLSPDNYMSARQWLVQQAQAGPQ